ncbi:MAG: ATP citrate lyase citrate-binding domain-containing protein [Pseudomonadota bacterium]
MQITGMRWGAKLLEYAGFPTSEVLGPQATKHEIQDLIDRWGTILIKPIFRGGIGKKGKAGLIGRASDLKNALRERERLYFAEHQHGDVHAKSEGVTFESAIPAKHEIYVSITDVTRFRAPTLTLTHHGGVDIEELPKDKVARVPFDPLTGLKGFIVSNVLNQLNAPNEIISPLVQNLPKLWDLFHHYGMTTIELNPIRMMPTKGGRLKAVACDFKCAFDTDDPNWKRLDLPEDIGGDETSRFEKEINQLRTYQGQSDVFVTNELGTVTSMTFGGGAASFVTELLGDMGTISSDFGGNPPYQKMFDISTIVYKYWLPQSNVLFIIGGKANNTDIYETFRAMANALRDYFNTNGPKPLYVVIGRGGPNLVRGLAYMKDTLDGLGLPYRIFGYDSSMSGVINYTKAIDQWMSEGGKKAIARSMKL